MDNPHEEHYVELDPLTFQVQSTKNQSAKSDLLTLKVPSAKKLTCFCVNSYSSGPIHTKHILQH